MLFIDLFANLLALNIYNIYIKKSASGFDIKQKKENILRIGSR